MTWRSLGVVGTPHPVEKQRVATRRFDVWIEEIALPILTAQGSQHSQLKHRQHKRPPSSTPDSGSHSECFVQALPSVSAV